MKSAFEGGASYTVSVGKASIRELTDEDEMLGYCTEFILQLMGERAFSLDAFKAFLDSVGSSVAAFQNDNIVKVHVHSFRPEEVLREAHGFGEFLTLKIENMTVKHSAAVIENEFELPAQRRRYGLVAAACGEGVRQMLANGGCTVVDGGRSMNPSAQDILKGIRQANAETVFVFPNHKNVFLAAKQAKTYGYKLISMPYTAKGGNGISLRELRDLQRPRILSDASLRRAPLHQRHQPGKVHRIL